MLAMMPGFAQADGDASGAMTCPYLDAVVIDDASERLKALAAIDMGHAEPCQFALSLSQSVHETVDYVSSQDPDRRAESEATFTLAGQLEQLYPAPFQGMTALPEDWAVFSGDASYTRQGVARPTSHRSTPRPAGSHPTSTRSDAVASGPVTGVAVAQFEPRLDNRRQFCLSVRMNAKLTGEGSVVHVLADGSVVHDRREYDLTLAGSDESVLGPDEIITCEGPPPSGAGPDCTDDPRSTLGDGVCESKNLIGCSSGGCQVEFWNRTSMVWYGLSANEDRTYWTLSGEVRTSDPSIIGGHHTEMSWSVDLNLSLVPRTLE